MMIKYVDDFKDYEVLDSGDMEKIERFGEYILRRPDPQAIWHSENFKKYKINAIYHRSKTGGGSWEFFDLPKKWTISYNLDKDVKMQFNLKPFTFKHTGIFPEQAVNWEFIYNFCKARAKDGASPKVLNLFAYTGAASMAAALGGAKVTHVDAAKGILTWAKENTTLSKIKEDRIRWILDDCKKFVEREIRRGSIYDGIIMDPPSYGRGPSGEVWKLENAIYDFVALTFKLLNKFVGTTRFERVIQLPKSCVFPLHHAPKLCAPIRIKENTQRRTNSPSRAYGESGTTLQLITECFSYTFSLVAVF